MLRKIIVGLVVVVMLIALAGMYKFNYMASKDSYDVNGNKIAEQINNFEECAAAGHTIMESYPEQCSDGKTVFTRIISEEEKKDNFVGGEQISKIPDFYKNLKVLKTSEFLVEISRSKKDCVGVGPGKCLQVKKEDGEWELFYDPIYGFTYEEGTFYVLKIEEKIYDVKNTENFPADVSDRTWRMLSVEKVISPEKEKDNKKEGEEKIEEDVVEEDLEMVVKIPRAELTQSGIRVDFDEFSVPQNDKILSATLEKLFEIRSATGNEADGVWNGLKFSGVTLDKKLATVTLLGSWLPVDDLSGFYFRQEIESAVMQFDAVEEVQVKVDGNIFDWCVDDVSGGEGECPDKKMLWDTRNYGDEGIMMTIKLPIIGDKYGKYPTEWKEYSVPRSTAVLTMTLKKFFEIHTTYGLQFNRVSLKNGVAKVFLNGNIKLSGTMSGIIFQTKMEGLVFQYPTVETLEVFVNDEILDLCIFGESDNCSVSPWITNRKELVY